MARDGSASRASKAGATDSRTHASTALSPLSCRVERAISSRSADRSPFILSFRKQRLTPIRDGPIEGQSFRWLTHAIHHSLGKRKKPASRLAPIPKHNPTAISCRRSEPCAAAIRGLLRLFSSARTPKSMTKAPVIQFGFRLFMPAMLSQNGKPPRPPNTQPPFGVLPIPTHYNRNRPIQHPKPNTRNPHPDSSPKVFAIRILQTPPGEGWYPSPPPVPPMPYPEEQDASFLLHRALHQ